MIVPFVDELDPYQSITSKFEPLPNNPNRLIESVTSGTGDARSFRYTNKTTAIKILNQKQL